MGAALAGCTDLFETESVWSGAPLVENRPDAVYVPASTEAMGSYGVQELADGARCSLHYTFPHRFWTVTGSTPSRVEVAKGDSMHLMVSVWDPESGVVLPRQPTGTLLEDGEPVDSLQFWSMLAQRMGFHFGNNVALPGEGRYEVRVSFDPIAVRTTGAFDGRFGDPQNATFEIDFQSSDVLDLSIDEIAEDRRGNRGAVPPMDDMGPPPGRVPPAEELPGTPLVSGRSSDAVLVGRLLDSPPAGIETDGQYLAVSMRTPYNRIALASSSLSARIDGETIDLRETIDDELDHHYGAPLQTELSSAPTIEIGSPPQLSRHDGYETAFFDMPPVELQAP
ncbi:iron transporter [Salinarchaeum chitinilyticum]